MSEKGDKALEAYSKARPYVYRGAKFAVPAALLSKMYSTKKLGPGVITAGAFAAGVGDKALEEAGRLSSIRKEKRRLQMKEKKANFSMDEDPGQGVFQRNPEAMLSQGMELSNVENTNAALSRLFDRKDEMARQSKDQLGSLFSSKDHYGRQTRLGMSADEASKVINRAFK